MTYNTDFLTVLWSKIKEARLNPVFAGNMRNEGGMTLLQIESNKSGNFGKGDRKWIQRQISSGEKARKTCDVPRTGNCRRK